MSFGEKYADFIFHKPRNEMRPYVVNNSKNSYSWENYSIAPKNNQLIISPSTLYHSVSSNLNLDTEQNDRISLSFNTFVSPLGCEKKRTLLNIV